MSPSYQILSHFRHCWPNKKPCSQGATTTYLRRSEADAQAFDLAEPAFPFGLGDAGMEVVADLDQTEPLGGVRPEHWAAHARVFVYARGSERASAGAGRDFASFEVAEELLPFLVGGGAVLLAGAQ